MNVARLHFSKVKSHENFENKEDSNLHLTAFDWPLTSAPTHIFLKTPDLLQEKNPDTNIKPHVENKPKHFKNTKYTVQVS